jgi:hypothetical protein
MKRALQRSGSLAVCFELLFAIAALGFGVANVFAQQTAPLSASKIRQAVTLYQGGQLQTAKTLLAEVDPKDPDYGLARCYNALCMYDLKDYRGYIKEMDNPIVEKAVVSGPVRSELEYRRIGALFYFRRFDDILSRAQSFQNLSTNSVQIQAVNEYRLATLFERGMKKAQEASWSKDPEKVQVRWTEAQTNLNDFLTRASAIMATNSAYRALTNRSLGQEIWAARITLGDEKKVEDKVVAQDAAVRERFGLMRIRLYQKLRENDIDDNLQIIGDFLNEFPASVSRQEVEFAKASYSFKRVEREYTKAETAERAGDKALAVQLRNSVKRDMETFRSLQPQAVVDKASGIEMTDILEMRSDLLHSYLLEKDFVQVISQADKFISESRPGDQCWVLAMAHKGIAFLSMPKPQFDDAAAALDRVIACGFKDEPHNDYYVILAAKWRIQLAKLQSDGIKAIALFRWVEQSNCRKNLRQEFLNSYKDFVMPPGGLQQ